MSDMVCQINKCTGCMACIDTCPQGAISIKDTLTTYNAVIDTEKCTNCNLCHKVCQNNNKPELKYPLQWFQGWASDAEIRAKASSGGIASALTHSFIKDGGIVCSCVFENGVFGFKMANTIQTAEQFVGSKYVKSNPKGIYKLVLKELKRGERVLFIGLPCQAEALRIYVGNSWQENLYTVDLICHGTPSPRLLEDYLKKYKSGLADISMITFRKKDRYRLAINDREIEYSGTVDRYLLAFLCSINFTENCYHCRYAGIYRGSDLTLGDSWGSSLSEEEQKKGISLILCQTEKGKKLLQNSEIELKTVDLENAILFNQQLREPSHKREKVDKFFCNYRGDFHKQVFRCLPGKCAKQKIKSYLLRLKIVRD